MASAIVLAHVHVINFSLANYFPVAYDSICCTILVSIILIYSGIHMTMYHTLGASGFILEVPSVQELSPVGDE